MTWPALFGIAVALIAASEPWLLSHTLFHDDSFYYVKVASNWATTGFMSFSGVGATTGFHPAWAYMIGAAFHLLSLFGLDVACGSLVVPIILSTVNAVVFVVASYFGVYGLRKDRLHSTLVTLIFFGFTWRFLFDGMESGLVLVLLSTSFWAAVHSRFLVLGLLTSLMPWVRMDATPFSLLFLLMAFACFSRRDRSPSQDGVDRSFAAAQWLRAVVVLGPTLFSALLRQIIFGSQISESVKFYWFGLRVMRSAEAPSSPIKYSVSTALDMISDLARIFDPLAMVFNPAVGFNSDPFGAGIMDMSLVIVVTLVWAVVIVRIVSAGKLQIRSAYFVFSFFAMSTGGLYLFVVKFFGFWLGGWNWYLAAPVYTLLVAGLFFWYGLHGGSVPAGVNIVMRWLSLGVIAGLIIGNVRFIEATLHPRPSEWRWLYAKMVVAVDELPIDADDSVGTWAAGHIGYFSRHRIVNLEGLIESPEVLDASLRDDIRPILASHRIKYIVIKSTPDAIRDAVTRAASGTPRWRMSIRERVFKDLVWEPVVVSVDPALRSSFSIHRVGPR